MNSFQPFFLVLAIVAGLTIFMYRKKWLARIPDGIRSRLPLVYGGIGLLIWLAVIVNSVWTVKRQLQDRDPADLATVRIPTLPIEKGDVTLEEMDVHLVLVETHGSVISSDWKITQWRAPAKDGFEALPLLGEWVGYLDEFQLSEVNTKYRYFSYSYSIERPHASSSGSTSLGSGSWSTPKRLAGVNSDSRSSQVLIATSRVRSEAQVYFFLSKKEDPLQGQVIGLGSENLGDMQRVAFLDEISTLQDRLNYSAPEGVRWLSSLDLSVFVLALILALTSLLFPWHKGAVMLGLSVVCIFISIGLDRWSVSYAGEIAADGAKQPITRYLAMQQLRSSYFWRHKAAHAFKTANTEGFDETLLQRVASSWFFTSTFLSRSLAAVLAGSLFFSR